MDRDGILATKRVSRRPVQSSSPTYDLRREGDTASAKGVQANNQHGKGGMEKNRNDDLDVNCAFDET